MCFYTFVFMHKLCSLCLVFCRSCRLFLECVPLFEDVCHLIIPTFPRSSPPTFVGYFGLRYLLHRSSISHSYQMYEPSQLLPLDFPCYRLYLQLSSYCVITYPVQTRYARHVSQKLLSQLLYICFLLLLSSPSLELQTTT